MSVITGQQEQRITELTPEQVAKQYLKFDVSRGEPRLDGSHPYFDYLKDQQFDGKAIAELQARWKSQLTRSQRVGSGLR